jgi:thioredoxin-disulfide reductase
MEDIDQWVKTKLAEWVPGERKPDSSIATKSVQETSEKASDATLHSDEVCKRTTPADMTTEDLEAELERRKAEELSSSGVSSPCAHLNRQSADVNSVEQVVILGGGPAGLTAAIYAARSGLCPLVISPEFGGQLMMKGVAVENYPALPRGSGLDMIFMMRRQAESFGAELRNEAVAAVHVTTASGRPRDTFVVLTNKSVSINTKTIIIATGANTQWLGVPGEDRLRGRGVTTCAACDGYLYRGKRCSVVGGGDSALEDALMLLRLCEKVTIIHRRDSFRASQVLQTRVRESEVEVLWNHRVVGFIEDPATSQLGRVSLMNSNTGERTIIDVDATFIAIGYAPNTDMFKGQLEMLPGGSGYLTTQGKSTATSVPGVFAAGDVADPTYRQAVTSAGSGAQAALDAERWLNEQPSSV